MIVAQKRATAQNTEPKPGTGYVLKFGSDQCPLLGFINCTEGHEFANDLTSGKLKKTPLFQEVAQGSLEDKYPQGANEPQRWPNKLLKLAVLHPQRNLKR